MLQAKALECKASPPHALLCSAPPVRRLKPSVVALACALGVFAARADAANDPTIDWKTLETPHFRVTYYTGEKEIA